MTTTPSNALTLTILYNNIAHDPRLKTDWGFAALIERGAEVILFDTGGKGEILMANIHVLEIDPARVRQIVLSHAHSDHTGGLAAFLAAARQPRVYLLSEFEPAFIQTVQQQTEIVETVPGLEIASGMLSTGNVGGSIPEQALAVRTGKGLVIITGCAHPGIVEIVEKSIELTGDPVHLVLGGFHLRDKTESEIRAILAEFRRLGVKNAAPSHCTGELAIRMFAEEYGGHFIKTGAGSILHLED